MSGLKFKVLLIVRNMSSQKKTLASKLAKKEKVIKPYAVLNKQEKNTDVQDIEDLLLSPGSNNAVALPFSPLQTRGQRKLKSKRENSGLAAPSAPSKERRLSTDTTIAILKKNFEAKTKRKIVPQNKESAEAKNEERTVAKVNLKSETEFNMHDKYNLEWSPTNWLRQLENIRLMRAKSAAPVDTMGCHKCADSECDEKTQRFHKLVALMLSSQTKDETTYEAMQRLKKRTLTPTTILDISAGDLEKLLCPVSFYKNKTKYLKQTAQILVDKYNEDIPNNIKELVALPGVGPKMAHICMATAWNQVTGIGVDVHVHRISNRLGWLKKPTKEPEQTRVGLESWLPRELWAEVNHLFVGFGQTVCAPVKPKCQQCLNVDICPAAIKTGKS